MVSGDKSGFGKASVGTNVGNDAESICGKCGDVWHVIVAKVGDTIAQVQCKQCGAVHRYRPPARAKQPKAAKEPRPPRMAAAPGEKAPRSPRAAATPKAPPGPRVAIDPLRPVRKYRPSETFRVGDPIEHATFGRGVVEALPDTGKIEVWFSGERRVLIHGRTPPTESAPQPARAPMAADDER